MIDKGANHKGGGQLSEFYNDNRIIAYKSGNKITGDVLLQDPVGGTACGSLR